MKRYLWIEKANSLETKRDDLPDDAIKAITATAVLIYDNNCDPNETQYTEQRLNRDEFVRLIDESESVSKQRMTGFEDKYGGDSKYTLMYMCVALPDDENWGSWIRKKRNVDFDWFYFAEQRAIKDRSDSSLELRRNLTRHLIDNRRYIEFMRDKLIDRNASRYDPNPTMTTEPDDEEEI